MKKITVAFLAMALLTAPAAFAADECTVSISIAHKTTLFYRNPEATLTCDGNSGSTTITAAHLSQMGFPRFLYSIETIPGTGGAEPSAYTVAVANDNANTLVSLAARAADANEFGDASEDLGYYPPITGPLTVTLGDLGAANSTVVNLIFLK